MSNRLPSWVIMLVAAICLMGLPNKPATAALTPEQLADNLYRAVVEGTPVIPHVRAIFATFGFRRVTATATDAVVQAAMEGLEPVIFSGQDRLNARLLVQRKFVDLKSFLAELNRRGYRTLEQDPLTAAYFAGVLSYVEDKPVLEAQDLLPALVLELAKARGRWLGTQGNASYWRDGLLDPIQFTILSYGVLQVSRLADAPLKLKQIADSATAAQDAVEKVADTLCILKSAADANVRSFAQRPFLYHQQETPDPPFTSFVGAEVTRIVTSDLSEAAARYMDCALPEEGQGWPGLSVNFDPQPAARAHGGLSRTRTKTDADGQATAVYQTIREQAPPDERTPETERSEVVSIEFAVSGIAPRGWFRTLFRQKSNPIGIKVFYYSGHWVGKVRYEVQLEASGTIVTPPGVIIPITFGQRASVSSDITLRETKHQGRLERNATSTSPGASNVITFFGNKTWSKPGYGDVLIQPTTVNGLYHVDLLVSSLPSAGTMTSTFTTKEGTTTVTIVLPDESWPIDKCGPIAASREGGRLVPLDEQPKPQPLSITLPMPFPPGSAELTGTKTCTLLLDNVRLVGYP